MHDNYIMVAIGFVLILLGLLAKGFSYGMAPHRQKTIYPVARPLRVVLFSLGLLSLAFGLVGVLRK
jgi:hypothetical protein